LADWSVFGAVVVAGVMWLILRCHQRNAVEPRDGLERLHAIAPRRPH
jgi:hypothetical protein